MYVKVVDIFEEKEYGFNVAIEVNNERIIAEWRGDKPEKYNQYNVEVDIDDNFIQGKNIIQSKGNKASIREGDGYVTIIAKLEYNAKDNLGSINIEGSIIMIDLEGIESNISNEWVEVKCSSIILYDVNL